MFVMLSVRTSTVRERQSDETGTKVTATINNIINNNIGKNIVVYQPSIVLDKEQIVKPAQTKSNFLLTELNNFKKPQPVQVPVATILNDLSPVPAPAKVKNKKGLTPVSPMTPKGLQNNSPDAKAMRYYRLWIYTCNAVLLMAVIVFCGVAGKVLLADYKRLLVTGLNLGQPSFIYAYLALLVQSGFLQLIGCLGALRLSEKLLNAYWSLLLVLLLGDAILGIFWMFKFDRIMHELQPFLKYRLATDYGNFAEFSDVWDKLQAESKCCGVIGPSDYSSVNRSYPSSCCSSDITESIAVSRRPLASAVVFHSDGIRGKANMTEIQEITWSHVITNKDGEESKSIVTCRVYQQGCYDKLITWLKSTADILFVIGYCIIAFLKLSFLGILRYEIKEMIQKIKLMQTELSNVILGHEEPQHTLLSQIPSTVLNGGIHAEPKVGNRDRERTRFGSQDGGERESLLINDNTPKFIKHKQVFACGEQHHHHMHHHVGPGGETSDTNSNCALIIEDMNPATKTINGNNNYELSEFDTKAPTYRLLNAPTVTKI